MGVTGAGQMERDEEQNFGQAAPEAELRIGMQTLPVSGRTLRLILWLVRHQARINETAPDTGQIWLTWKGDGRNSIAGDIRTRL